MSFKYPVTLSNGEEYTFSVSESLLNRPESIQFIVNVTSDSLGSWTTSFNEKDIDSYCSYMARYLTKEKATLQDVSRIASLFYSLLNSTKSARETQLLNMFM